MERIRILAWAAAAATASFTLFFGCASTGVVATGKDTYLIAKKSSGNVNRVMGGARDSVMPFVQSSVLTVVCLVGIVILVWPELRGVIKRAT
jgi:hypothetical protein